MDRLKNDHNSLFQKGNLPRSGRKEICHRFNKGKCTYGASCKFEHRCSAPKCGKFGHGAHMCHNCNGYCGASPSQGANPGTSGDSTVEQARK